MRTALGFCATVEEMRVAHLLSKPLRRCLMVLRFRLRKPAREPAPGELLSSWDQLYKMAVS